MLIDFQLMTLRKRFVTGYCSNTNKDNVSLFSFPKDASFSRHCVQFVTGIATNLCCGGWEPRRLRRRVRDASRRKGHGGGVIGYPLSGRQLRLGGLDERRKLPQRQRGSCRDPAENAFWCIGVGAHSTLGGAHFCPKKCQNFT